jgi:superfamily II DNA helicase RecQ
MAVNNRQAAERFVNYIQEYDIVVCRACQHAVAPAKIAAHFRGSVHRCSREQIRAIRERVKAYSDTISGPAHVEIPLFVEQPVAGLRVCRDGLMCDVAPEECRYICRTINSIKTHIQRKHEKARFGRRGQLTSRQQAQADDEAPLWKSVVCQQFYASGEGAQFFEVRGADEGENNEEEGENNEDNRHAWQRFGQRMEEVHDEIAEAERRAIEAGGPRDANPWLKRTGWGEYLDGFDRDRLLDAIVEPDAEKEPQVAAIWRGMDRMMSHCQRTAATSSHVGHFVRMEAVRTELHQTRYQPLQPYMDRKEIGEYGRPWKQMVVFIARTQRRHRWESPPYRLTGSQRKAWKKLREAVTRETEEREEARSHTGGVQEPDEQEQHGENHNDPGATTTSTWGSRSGEDERLRGVAKACLRFCVTLLNQKMRQREYESAMVCVLAVLGVKSDGWRDAGDYPPILSKVIKISRFMMIQTAVHAAEREGDRSDSSRPSSREHASARPERVGCLGLVARMMDEFMIRGSHSPMQWMLDLRTYGLKIHYNTTGAGHIDWTGDRILYKQIQFSMADFRGMIHGLVQKARQLLIEEILFCYNEKDIPSILWTQLRDDPNNARPRWNFIQDTRHQWAVDGRHWLFNRIGAEASIRGQFILDSTGEFDPDGVDRWMYYITNFRELFLLCVQISWGQPARGPEILAIHHSNTAQGEYRNIFIEDGAVVVVARYHKGYSISGDVKIIHRYLPREVGELLVWYMWLVLPFQQRLESIRWQQPAIPSKMWPDDPDGRKWTSERMRKVMKRESMMAMGVELGIQSYRECAIGISRRYLQASRAFQRDEEDEDGDGDEDQNAIVDEQAGHTSHVAGIIYARGIMERSGEVYNKRRRFREASEMWHAFLGFGHVPHATKRAAPFEQEAQEAQITRRKRLRGTDAQQSLTQMMGEGSAFRGIQAAAVKAIMDGESPVVVVMGTGGGKSLMFMLPAWCGAGGTSVVVVPLIALREDMKRRCEALGIRCAEWKPQRPPDAAQVVLVTPESAVKGGFHTFMNRLKALGQLDRIVVDEAHTVLNDQMGFRKQMQQLGVLTQMATQTILMTATLPPSREATLWRRMGWRAEEVRMFRGATTRANVRYRVERVRGRNGGEEGEGVRQKVRECIGRWSEGTDGGKVVIYANTVDKVQGLAAELECEAYHHHAAEKAEIMGRFRSGESRVIVATSALGMGIDIADIRAVVHVDIPRTLLDYGQESGRAGRDGKTSLAVVMVEEGDYRRWMSSAEREEGEGRKLVRRYMEGDGGAGERCRRVVLDGYLDGREDRRGCEEGEERCDGCGGREETAPARDEEEEAARGEGEAVAARQERMARVEDAAITRQDQQRVSIRWRQQQGRRTEAEEVEEVRQQLQRMRGRCPSCVIDGVGPSSHVLFRCRRAESEASRELYIDGRGKIRKWKSMAKYSGCQWCLAPQEWCSRWEHSAEEGQMYRQVAGAKCEFDEVVLSTFAALVVKCGEFSRGFRERVRASGFGSAEEEEGEGDDDDDDESERRRLRYLGQQVRWGGIEGSQLLREFWIGMRLVEGKTGSDGEMVRE